MRQTLPKSIILRGYQSFTKVITAGTPLYGTMLNGFLLTNTNDKQIAIGFSVPKKRVPLAVHRNRIRRLMRESVRKNFGEIISAATTNDVGLTIVLMYKGEKQTDIKRLSLQNIEPSWKEIHQQILKAL